MLGTGTLAVLGSSQLTWRSRFGLFHPSSIVGGWEILAGLAGKRGMLERALDLFDSFRGLGPFVVIV